MTSTISDEQVRAALAAAMTGDYEEFISADSMRAALEAYDRTRAPDPRVVELVAVAKKAERALRAYGMAMIQRSPLPVDLGPYFKDADELRAALAAMEKKDG